MLDISENTKTQGLLFVNFFYPVDPFNGVLVLDITAVGIYGIGGIYDDTTLIQNVTGLLYETLLGIFSMDYEYHSVRPFATDVPLFIIEKARQKH
jgi:hypothetical protein